MSFSIHRQCLQCGRRDTHIHFSFCPPCLKAAKKSGKIKTAHPHQVGRMGAAGRWQRIAEAHFQHRVFMKSLTLVAQGEPDEELEPLLVDADFQAREKF